MNVYHLKENDYKVSRWSGGKTKELAIYPKGSDYLSRNFNWRISSATCELDESDFSKLPDYNRVLMVLDGQVILNYNGEKTVKLGELEQDSFDGGWKTKSYGKITDFNLMVRKEAGEGWVDIISPTGDSIEYTSTHESPFPVEKTVEAHALYVKEGYAIVGYTLYHDDEVQDIEVIEEMIDEAETPLKDFSAQKKSLMVKAGETLIFDCELQELPRYTIMGEGTIIRSQIITEADSVNNSPVDIPAEKVSFDDWKMCLFLSNSQFHGARYIFKRMQRTWYDEALSKRLRLLEKSSLTLLVFIAGVLLISLYGLKRGIDDMKILELILLWIPVDSVLISPLVFLPFLPKPIRKHVKDVETLTPYEQKVREYELSHNARTEKLMKKYRSTEERMRDKEERKAKRFRFR